MNDKRDDIIESEVGRRGTNALNSEHSQSLDDIMQRLRLGDEEAAFRIFQRYSRRLAGLARTRLQGVLAAKVDEEDVLQSVFRSFFQRQREGQFEIESWNSLWSLLTVITLRKCRKQIDYFRAACRNIGRESPPLFSDDDAVQSCLAIAREPTPDESAQLIEAIEMILSGLSTRDRNIVERTLQGEAPISISSNVRCSERTVERVRAKLLDKLMKMLD